MTAAPAHFSFDWKDIDADLDRLLCRADEAGVDGLVIGDFVEALFPRAADGSRPWRIVSGRTVPPGAVERLAERAGTTSVVLAVADEKPRFVPAREKRVWNGAKLRQSDDDTWWDAVADASAPDDGSFVFYEAATRRRSSRWRVVFSASKSRDRIYSVAFVRPLPEDAPPRTEVSRG
jgi:hypothetical protein